MDILNYFGVTIDESLRSLFTYHGLTYDQWIQLFIMAMAILVIGSIASVISIWSASSKLSDINDKLYDILHKDDLVDKPTQEESEETLKKLIRFKFIAKPGKPFYILLSSAIVIFAILMSILLFVNK